MLQRAFLRNIRHTSEKKDATNENR